MYEAKSNNLAQHREETFVAIHCLVGKFDNVQQLLVQARSTFTTDVDEHTQIFNMQLPG